MRRFRPSRPSGPAGPKTLTGILAASTLALGLPACGGDDDDGPHPGPLDPALVGRVQPVVPEVYYVDLAAARAQLGIPEDAPADAPAVAGDLPSSESIEFVNIAGSGLTFLTPGRSTPLMEAIDSGQVRAAASSHTFSAESVDALRTEQPFDDIAASLETAGFTRDGDVLASPDADLARERFAAVADAGDGIVLLAGSKGAAARALAAPVETEAADLLGRVSGVVRGALTPHPPRGCLTALVVGQDAAPAEGELELVIDGEVEPDRFALEDRASSAGGGLEFGEPEASAETLRVRVTYDSGQALSRPINLLTGGVSPREVYRC